MILSAIYEFKPYCPCRSFMRNPLSMLDHRKRLQSGSGFPGRSMLKYETIFSKLILKFQIGEPLEERYSYNATQSHKNLRPPCSERFLLFS